MRLIALTVVMLGVSSLVLSANAPLITVPTTANSSQLQANSVMINLSLVEALTAIRNPQLTGIFAFITEQNSPFAFADLLARDTKALKLYVDKIRADQKVANGLTVWDHNVCACLVNLYASPLAASFNRPDAKRMSSINECVLSPVVSLEQIIARRKG